MNGDFEVLENEDARPQAPRKLEHLSLLYEGVLTAIVRIQSGRQQIQNNSEAFRAKMKSVLEDIGRAAVQRGYTREDIQEGNFAIIAFLDEAVLTSNDSGRTQWARKTLQEELYNQRSAGELFFKRLDELRANRDSAQLAEVLEVYYLCLLLGYEGKYAVGSKAELHLLMNNLRERIERLSGRAVQFSADAQLPPQKARTAVVDPLPRKLRMIALAALAFVLLCFVFLKLNLSSRGSDLHSVMQQAGRPSS